MNKPPVPTETGPFKRPRRHVKLSLRLTEGEASLLKEMARLGGFKCLTSFIRFSLFEAPQYISVTKALKILLSEVLKL